jgi:hypothetical protein
VREDPFLEEALVEPLKILWNQKAIEGYERAESGTSFIERSRT